jgi:hypothetical protein
MSKTKLRGHGRLAPARSTGVTYKVHYGIAVAADSAPKGKAPLAWINCSVRLPHAGQLPDGSYFLYTEEGKVFQLRSTAGKWRCLALAA